MNSEKKKWIKKYTGLALRMWRNHSHSFEVSDEYRQQLESDLATQYDDPLKRSFIEKSWVT